MANNEYLSNGQKKKVSKWDKFWSAFLFTKEGKVKSTLLINSFCLSVLFLAVYVLAFLLLVEPLENLLSGRLPGGLISFIESVVPSVLGSMICCLCHFPFKEKRLVPAAYLWILLYAVGACVVVLVGLAAEDRLPALRIMMLFVPAPLLTGCGLSLFLYLSWLRTNPGPVEELPPWKRRQ